MPKSRKKRTKLQDFRKVKLKVGRRVERSQETKLTFKTRTIQVPKQISANDTASRTRVFTPDIVLALLKKSQSGSIKNQQETLEEIHQGLIRHTTLNRSALFCPILERCSDTFCDSNPTSRLFGRKLLSWLLGHCDEEVFPNFDTSLFPNLVRSMLHLHEDVRFDSHHVVDLLLDKLPRRLRLRCSDFLPTYLQSISRIEGQRRDRQLPVNPGSRWCSPQERLKVLDRILRFLQSMTCALTEYKAADEAYKAKVPPSWSDQAWPQEVPWLVVEGRSRVYTFLNEHCGHDGSFVQLVPLILQCWSEVYCSEQESLGQEQSIITNSSMVMLHKALECLLAFNQVCQTWGDSCPDLRHLPDYIKTRHFGEIKRYFLDVFPVSVRKDRMKRGQSKEAFKSITSPATVNFVIFELSSIFLLVDVADDIRWWQPLERYIRDRIQSGRLSIPQLTTVIKVMLRLLNDSLRGVAESQVTFILTSPLFSRVLPLLRALHDRTCQILLNGDEMAEHDDQQLVQLLKFWSQMVRSHGSVYVQLLKSLIWFPILPRNLLKNLPKLRTVKSVDLLAGIVELIRVSVRNDTRSETLLASNSKALFGADGLCYHVPADARQYFMDLLPLLPTIPEDQLSILTDACLEGRLCGLNCMNALMDNLSLVYLGLGNQLAGVDKDISQLVRVLFSMAMGANQRTMRLHCSSDTTYSLGSSEIRDDFDNWLLHKPLIQISLEYWNRLRPYNKYWQQFLSRVTTLLQANFKSKLTWTMCVSVLSGLELLGRADRMAGDESLPQSLLLPLAEIVGLVAVVAMKHDLDRNRLTFVTSLFRQHPILVRMLLDSFTGELVDCSSDKALLWLQCIAWMVELPEVQRSLKQNKETVMALISAVERQHLTVTKHSSWLGFKYDLSVFSGLVDSTII